MQFVTDETILHALCGADYHVASLETRRLFSIPGEHGSSAGKGTQFAQAVQELGLFFVMFRVIGDQGRRPPCNGGVARNL
jgi:hypothetical protein